MPPARYGPAAGTLRAERDRAFHGKRQPVRVLIRLALSLDAATAALAARAPCRHRPALRAVPSALVREVSGPNCARTGIPAWLRGFDRLTRSDSRQPAILHSGFPPPPVWIGGGKCRETCPLPGRARARPLGVPLQPSVTSELDVGCPSGTCAKPDLPIPGERGTGWRWGWVWTLREPDAAVGPG
jgi:hypothetical protein